MEINLLPSRSLFDKYRLLLILAPTLLLLGVAILFFVNLMQMNEDLATKRGELTSVTSENSSLQAERTMDAKTKLFHQIQQAVRNVQTGEHAPGPILDGITAKLPDNMRITTAAMDADSQKVTLTLEADTIDHIAEYATLLRVEPWVKDVVVQDIEQTKSDKQAPQPAQASENSSANPLSGPSVNPSDFLPDKSFAYKSQVILTLVPPAHSATKSSK